MGFKRVLGSGIVGMLCLLPMAWFSFYFLDLTSQITGGLIKNVAGLGEVFGQGGDLIMFVIGAFIGLFLICLFPIHWAIIYSPNDIMLLLAIILPWILCCSITSALFAHSPRGGFDTSLAIGLGYMFLFVGFYFVIIALLGQIPGGSAIGAALLNGVVQGATDMPYMLAVVSATMEGAAVGGVFGAFIGSLRYKAEGDSSAKPKKSKKSKDKSFEVDKEPTLDSFSSFGSKPPTAPSASDFCTNCGAKLTGSDEFCTNCGAKRK